MYLLLVASFIPFNVKPKLIEPVVDGSRFATVINLVTFAKSISSGLPFAGATEDVTQGNAED